MDLISVGSQILLFVTGRGSVIGAPVAPLVKITGNSETYRNLSDDIDFNAGRLLTGERTLDELGDELLAMTIDSRRRRADQARAARPPRVLRDVQAPGHAAARDRLPGVNIGWLGSRFDRAPSKHRNQLGARCRSTPATRRIANAAIMASNQLAGSGTANEIAPLPLSPCSDSPKWSFHAL